MQDNELFYIISQPFKATSINSYSTPYDYCDEVTLPVGLIIKLDSEINDKDRVVYASPSSYEQWEEVFAFYAKDSSNYTGYSLLLQLDDLKNHCQATQKSYSDPHQLINTKAFEGCLLGTAMGDSIGLPFEGLSRKRIKQLLKTPLNHQFIFGYGMLSDDTEHSCIVAQSLIKSSGETSAFQRQLSKRLKLWFLALPAGIGMATLRAIIKLCFGFSANKSGVFSAGNGPMMRSAILGVYAGDKTKYLEQLSRINTKITHTDLKAELAAQIIAQAAYLSSIHVIVTAENFSDYYQQWLDKDEELADILNRVVDSIKAKQSTEDFCRQQGMLEGVSGYCYQTLSVVMHICLCHPENFEQAITDIIKCGGDTDTIAAIAGGIIGARVGKAGIPKRWLVKLKDWPCSVSLLSLIAHELAIVKLMNQPRYAYDTFFPFILIRNLIFMLFVLAHGFRRLFPPY